jgi:hypothetical protein
MSRRLYPAILLAMLLGVATFAGCELTVSVHPLSDEATSTLDDRLIGTWEMVRPAEQTPGPSEVPPRFVYGKVAGKPNILECVTTELDGDGYAQVRRIPLYPCQLGELHYLSIAMHPEEPKEKQVYLIMLYELKDDSELRFYMLNKDVIGPAIEREDLAGIVTKSDPDPNAPLPEQVKPKYREVRITAEPKELAAYLQRRGKEAYYMAEYFTLRRVEPK